MARKPNHFVLARILTRVVHRLFTDQAGAHSSIKTRFSLGARLLISFNAPVNNLNHQNERIKLWQKP